MIRRTASLGRSVNKFDAAGRRQRGRAGPSRRITGVRALVPRGSRATDQVGQMRIAGRIVTVSPASVGLWISAIHCFQSPESRNAEHDLRLVRQQWMAEEDACVLRPRPQHGIAGAGLDGNQPRLASVLSAPTDWQKAVHRSQSPETATPRLPAKPATPVSVPWKHPSLPACSGTG